MSSLTPSGGRPDHEEPNYPHGSALATASAVSVNGTTVLSGINVESVGAYRSLVIQVKNNGTRDLTFTPEWDFYNGAAHIRSTDSQIVPAGTSKRLIFQNQGDLLNKVTVTGGGAGDTINHYIAPSNLDPLASKAPDYILLFGVHKAIPAVVGGDSGECPFDATTYQTNDTGLWTFTLDGSGNIVEVLAAKPGRYESHCNFVFDPPSAATRESCLINVFGTIPIPNKMSPITSDLTTDDYMGMVGAFSNYTSGTGIWTVQYDFDRASSGGIEIPYWWIKRWAI